MTRNILFYHNRLQAILYTYIVEESPGKLFITTATIFFYVKTRKKIALLILLLISSLFSRSLSRSWLKQQPKTVHFQWICNYKLLIVFWSMFNNFYWFLFSLFFLFFFFLEWNDVRYAELNQLTTLNCKKSFARWSDQCKQHLYVI